MPVREHLRTSIEHMSGVLDAYTSDLTDADLLHRPTPGSNHIAWQLGHLLGTQSFVIGTVFPGRLPPLPDGFAQRHTKDQSGLDTPGSFSTRDEYAAITGEQRAAVLELIDSVSEDELAAASPEPFGQTGTVGVAVGFVSCTHWLWHAGQWTVIRASLGRSIIV